MRPPSPPARGQLSRHHQGQAAAARARNFILIIFVILAGDPVLIIGVIDFLATAVLIKPVLLLMSIPMARQLRCWRQFRRLIMAPRGGLLPKVTLGGHASPVTIGLTDQSGEFCNGVAFSVGLETFISHSDCSESSCARILTRKRSITTTRADADYQFQSTMNLKCCHGEIAGVDARCQSPLDRPSRPNSSTEGLTSRVLGDAAPNFYPMAIGV
jgi:hypothetical protein